MTASLTVSNSTPKAAFRATGWTVKPCLNPMSFFSMLRLRLSLKKNLLLTDGAARLVSKVMVAIHQLGEAESIHSNDVAVCHCYNIRQSHIRNLIEEGPHSMESLCEKTGAGSGCGGCRCRLQRLLMGLPLSCGPCSFCSGCGSLQKNCQCSRN